MATLLDVTLLDVTLDVYPLHGPHTFASMRVFANLEKRMPKITFIGAGSSVFAKNILGDSLLTPSLQQSHIALYDIDATRLKESKLMMDTLNANINAGRATITTHLGTANRKAALKGANYIVNAVQIGGYKPSTVIDFEIPKRYGLRQTIADTLGVGGIMRALRTIPVILDMCRIENKNAAGRAKVHLPGLALQADTRL